MSRIFGFIVGLLLLVCQQPGLTVAHDALQRIPENALGFVVIHNLSEASDKVEQLLEPCDVAFPAPLTFGKIVTGLDEGLDTSGTMVVALLSGDSPAAAPEPLVLLPVADYEEFADSINADTSGDICRVTLLGEDILVARDGSYAMLMNVEHQSTMQELVALPPEPLATLAPVVDWLSEQDVAIVLMPTGIKTFRSKSPRANRLSGMGGDFSNSQSTLGLLLSLASDPGVVRWMHEHVEIATIGAAIDRESNLRIGKQLIFKERSPFANIASEMNRQHQSALGLSDQPCVFAASGPFAAGWGKGIAKFLRQAEQSSAAVNGMEKISAELWDEEEEAFRLLFAEVRSCSCVMLQGEKGDPLVGNFLGVATVADVSRYFESLPQVVKTWNKIIQESTSDMKMEFEISATETAGKKSCELVVDVATAAADPNTPGFNWMIESALGLEGKLRIRFSQLDNTTFAFGLATQSQMSELIQQIEAGNIISPKTTELQMTLSTLDERAPWKVLIRPQGCAYWGQRVANEFFAPITDQEVTMPQMPNSPPLGLTFDCQKRHWTFEAVCPAPTWVTLAKYLAAISDK